jgi:hypothetical protein
VRPMSPIADIPVQKERPARWPVPPIARTSLSYKPAAEAELCLCRTSSIVHRPRR